MLNYLLVCKGDGCVIAVASLQDSRDGSIYPKTLAGRSYYTSAADMINGKLKKNTSFRVCPLFDQSHIQLFPKEHPLNLALIWVEDDDKKDIFSSQSTTEHTQRKENVQKGTETNTTNSNLPRHSSI